MDSEADRSNLKSEKKVLNISFAGSIAFLLAEIFFAVYTHSKAILMDCVYDLADLVMIGPFMLLVPLLYKPVTEKRPYGFSQVESLFVLIKYCVLLGIDTVLVINCVKNILSGGNEVDASTIAIFEIAVSVGCVVMYVILHRVQKKYSSPSIKAELFIWKLDAICTLGVAAAFLINLILIRTPLAFICPYIDPGIAIILAVSLFKEPVEMIIESLRSLVLFSPEKEITEKVSEIAEGTLKTFSCNVTFMDVIKTGRKIWAEVYFLPDDRRSVDLDNLRRAHVEIEEAVKKEFDSVYIELIPDMESYHTERHEEMPARRQDVIRHMEGQEQKKALKQKMKEEKKKA